MPDIKHALSFDYGIKRIGVAVGQTITGTASPLPPLKAKDGIPNWQEIEKLIKEWKPDILLIGLPLNMDGSESEMSKRARKFANRLHGRFGKPFELVDERLSSEEAKYDFRDQGIYDFGENSVDGMVAKILFEDWCDQQA
ncbi:Holliday junction resolvase RuvX [Litoribrevibacter albus]|uniref:Putative pre-16S rRNA nuclease n=1 Tax=Litoribrevibacter albus TaxID=1473156 RepID=A0AA37W5G8_9GAMM|nr:Holliday junction resolvase RuvX [Litoribrevibacter albus]GLQ30565.1 putative pre-16S rRNA nuclease [Litoribrevibacter albus]